MTVNQLEQIEQLIVDVDTELATVKSLENPDLPNLMLFKIKKNLLKQKKDLAELKEAYSR